MDEGDARPGASWTAAPGGSRDLGGFQVSLLGARSMAQAIAATRHEGPPRRLPFELLPRGSESAGCGIGIPDFSAWPALCSLGRDGVRSEVSLFTLPPRTLRPPRADGGSFDRRRPREMEAPGGRRATAHGAVRECGIAGVLPPHAEGLLGCKRASPGPTEAGSRSDGPGRRTPVSSLSAPAQDRAASTPRDDL